MSNTPELRRIRFGRKTMTRGVAFGDAQCPFHDTRSWSLILQFIREFRPHFILNLGDDADCYHWSRYEKSKLERPPGYGNKQWCADLEIEAVHERWDQLKEAAPAQAVFLYCEGNHEQRVEKFYMGKGSDVQTGEDNFYDKFRVAEWWDEYAISFRIGKLMATHGTKTNIWAARTMLQDWGRSVIFGHTHRNCFWSRHTKDGDEHAAWGVPCHCRFDSHYISKPNWSHGFAPIHMSPGGWFDVTIVPIIKHQFCWGSKLYKYRRDMNPKYRERR